MNEIIAGLYQSIKALELQKNEMKSLQAKLDAKEDKLFEVTRQKDLMVDLFKQEELKVKELKMEIVALTGYRKLWTEGQKKYNRLMNVVKSKGIK